MKNVMKSVHNSIITVVVLLSLLPVYDHHHGHLATAASGGRMGGTSFRSGSRSRTSTSSYATSYSITRSSYSKRYTTARSPESSSFSTRIGSPVRQVFTIDLRVLDLCIIICTIYAICFLLRQYADGDRVKTSVLKLQVGLLGTARSLQKDLNHIAETADTSSPTGFRYILKETILSVLKHPEYCISGYCSVEVKKGVDECEKRFNRLSIEEREKFDEETLVNFNNIRKQTATSHEEVSNRVVNQYIVVTIIVAARGAYELPQIKSSELLKIALQKLASIPSNDILAAEVLWTPQKKDDCLTEQEMLKDYLFLCPL